MTATEIQNNISQKIANLRRLLRVIESEEFQDIYKPENIKVILRLVKEENAEELKAFIRSCRNDYNVREMQAKAKQLGINKYWRFNKEQLQERINARTLKESYR